MAEATQILKPKPPPLSVESQRSRISEGENQHPRAVFTKLQTTLGTRDALIGRIPVFLGWKGPARLFV